MADTFDKIRDAIPSQAGHGLTWIQSTETDDESRLFYDYWLLVDRNDRVLASIDGPTRKQLCYGIDLEGGTRRKYISLESAQRYAIASAMQILSDERTQKASARKARRMDRIRK